MILCRRPLMGGRDPPNLHRKSDGCGGLCGTLRFFILLMRYQLNMVGVDDGIFQLGAEVRVDRVHDIPVGAVRVLTGGHNDEKAFPRVDDLDIVNSQAVVKGDGDDGFHRSLIEKFADFDVSDLHFFTIPFLCWINLGCSEV